MKQGDSLSAALVANGLVSVDQFALATTSANEGEILANLIADGVVTEYQVAQLQKGQRSLHVGPYLIRDWYGAAGNNHVFLANGPTGRESCFIIIHANNTATRDSRRSFKRSEEFHRRIHSPHWLPIIDSGEEDGAFFVVVDRPLNCSRPARSYRYIW